MAAELVRGAPVDFTAVYAGRDRHRVPLPTAPLRRERYWVEPAGARNRIIHRVVGWISTGIELGHQAEFLVIRPRESTGFLHRDGSSDVAPPV